MIQPDKIRNIAIIAHVDHGKTTLVDQMFKYSGTFRDNEQIDERAMDSNDQERERGITITAKSTSVQYKDTLINIIDTPGHADFGGEVERILNMADGVLLLVDSVEGTMPQTRYVLGKALGHGLNPIVVINKVDRPNARVDAVIDMTFDLFVDLGANDVQCDFPVVYASALEGRASVTDILGGTDLEPLFQTIIEKVPAPIVEESKSARLLVTNLGYDDFLGKLVIGRLLSGSLTPGTEVKVFAENEERKGYRVSKILKRYGMKDEPIDSFDAGDIATIAGISEVTIGDTVATLDATEALERIDIDPPTLTMTFSVNDSPFAGTEGKFVTSRNLRERLYKEIEHNVSLKVEDTDSAEKFKVSGRGELHLSVLIETMRREGYELQVSMPEVIMIKNEDGKVEEPFEQVFVEVPTESSGTVIDSLNRRKGEMQQMTPVGSRVEIEFLIPSRGLLGYRSQFLTETKGEGTINSLFSGYGPFKGEIKRRLRGSIICANAGESVAYAIFNLQQRGEFFISPGVKCYEGMIIGEHGKENDLEVNISKNKKLTNVRASGTDEAIKLITPRQQTIESILEFVAEDELMEVTPKTLRIRKKHLTETGRKSANRSSRG
jgi:GTP-binding protein